MFLTQQTTLKGLRFIKLQQRCLKFIFHFDEDNLKANDQPSIHKLSSRYISQFFSTPQAWQAGHY